MNALIYRSTSSVNIDDSVGQMQCGSEDPMNTFQNDKSWPASPPPNCSETEPADLAYNNTTDDIKSASSSVSDI